MARRANFYRRLRCLLLFISVPAGNQVVGFLSSEASTPQSRARVNRAASSALEVESQSVAVYVFAKKNRTLWNADLPWKTQVELQKGGKSRSYKTPRHAGPYWIQTT